MSPKAWDGRNDAATLSVALRLIRRRRQMRVADVAAAMNLSQRTYEHFEAGRGRINLDYIRRFARATDSDPLAIVAALQIGSPEFAARCADNKLMMIFGIALREFDETLGDRIAAEDARTLIEAFTRVFRELQDASERRAAAVDRWMSGGSASPPAADPKRPPDEGDGDV